MHLSEFTAIAGRGDAQIILDSKTNELKAHRQDRLHRTVRWIRESTSPNRHAQIEKDGALALFMQAIAAHSAYDAGDKSRADALLFDDVDQRRPLTSLRIREVLTDMDERSTRAMRENRTTASWMAGRGVDMHLREQHPDVNLSHADRNLLAGRIRAAIHGTGGDGRHKVGVADATAITNGLVDALVAKKTAAAQAAVKAAQDASMASARTLSSGEGDSTAAQAESVQPENRRATPGTAPQDAASPKRLQSMLAAANLPREVQNQVRKAVESGQVANETDLARHANRRLADWVMENRIGRWCGETQQRLGLVRHINDGETLMVSAPLLRKVRETIADSTELLSYAQIKTSARALIDAHMENELGQRVA